jgi:uncharacterized membrane protein
MKRLIAGYLVLAILVLAGLIHAGVYYRMLPAQVASHFDIQGQPDGWMSKGAFVSVYVGMLLGSGIVMAALGLLLPRTPDSLINLPHKDYWLAPERRRATLLAVSADFSWFASATIAFLIAMFQACFTVTLGRQMPEWFFPVTTGIYVAFCVLWSVQLLWRFRKPKEA